MIGIHHKTVPANQSTQMNQANTTSDSQNMNAPENQKPMPMKVVRDGNNVSIDMYTERTTVQIAPGVSFPAWTFDGTVPGPVLYLTQGDNVRLTLHNLDKRMPHSIDLHDALINPKEGFVDVPPNTSKTLEFVASLPGVFMYHCESAPMVLHIAQGMYGAVVVTPSGEPRPTYTIVQSEFYQANSYQSVMNDNPTYVVFNGQANRYMDSPLTAKVGQNITVAFVNAGPNNFSAFHVVGSILRDVEASGNPENHLYNVQTYTVAPGDAALIHLQFDAPGTYSFVSHSMKDMSKGAMGAFQVTK